MFRTIGDGPSAWESLLPAAKGGSATSSAATAGTAPTSTAGKAPRSGAGSASSPTTWSRSRTWPDDQAPDRLPRPQPVNQNHQTSARRLFQVEVVKKLGEPGPRARPAHASAGFRR